ncbi:MAG: hypothetical protein WB795_06650 [Candidatus Acidiferrales bacterium]
MLTLVRQQMVGNAKQVADRDVDADLFERLADRAVLDSFQKIHLPADNAPTFRFWRVFSQRQQHSATFINQENADIHPGL